MEQKLSNIAMIWLALVAGIIFIFGGVALASDAPGQGQKAHKLIAFGVTSISDPGQQSSPPEAALGAEGKMERFSSRVTEQNPALGHHDSTPPNHGNNSNNQTRGNREISGEGSVDAGQGKRDRFSAQLNRNDGAGGPQTNNNHNEGEDKYNSGDKGRSDPRGNTRGGGGETGVNEGAQGYQGPHDARSKLEYFQGLPHVDSDLSTRGSRPGTRGGDDGSANEDGEGPLQHRGRIAPDDSKPWEHNDENGRGGTSAKGDDSVQPWEVPYDDGLASENSRSRSHWI
ncbi:MAG: hypothetical protein LBE38_01410 [Deltaproteobacteria bacterium]|nr:hypothetical protein [Deltaproteobacteria bacterium]